MTKILDPLSYSGYGLNNYGLNNQFLRPGGYLSPYSSVFGSNYYNQGIGGMPLGGGYSSSGVLPYSTLDPMGVNSGIYGQGYSSGLYPGKS